MNMTCKHCEKSISSKYLRGGIDFGINMDYSIADMWVIQLLQCRLWESKFLYAIHENHSHPEFHRGSAIPAYEQCAASKQIELQFGSTGSNRNYVFLQCSTFEHCGIRSDTCFPKASSIFALSFGIQENQFNACSNRESVMGGNMNFVKS